MTQKRKADVDAVDTNEPDIDIPSKIFETYTKSNPPRACNNHPPPAPSLLLRFFHSPCPPPTCPPPPPLIRRDAFMNQIPRNPRTSRGNANVDLMSVEHDKRKPGVFLVMHGDPSPVRRALDLGSKLEIMYKYAHDLPQQLDTDGKLIPKHDGIIEGWYLLYGDVADIF